MTFEPRLERLERCIYLVDTLSGRGPTEKSMWHAGVEGRPQGKGHRGESESELGSAGDGEVPGFRSWRSGGFGWF